MRAPREPRKPKRERQPRAPRKPTGEQRVTAVVESMDDSLSVYDRLAPGYRVMIDHYLTHGRKGAALEASGYGHGSWAATAIFRWAIIRRAIAERRAELQQQVAVDREMLIEELTAIAFARAGDLVSWGPGGVVVRPSDELSDDALASVASVTETVTDKGTRTIRVKQHDKLAALKQLAQLKGYTETEAARPVDIRINLVYADRRRVVDAGYEVEQG